MSTNENKEEIKEEEIKVEILSSDEENDEEEKDGQDETQPMIGGIIYPYRYTLPVPEPAIDSVSIPIFATCLVCKVNLISTISYPCCHASMCVECARTYGQLQNTCPVCRTGLMSIEKMYLSYITYEEEKEGGTENLEPPKKKRKISY